MAHGHSSLISFPFSPLKLSPWLWCDAADSSTITEASNKVSQWNDKSGNARHISQATSNNQPETGINTINSLNVIRFDGSTDALASGALSVLTKQHVFVVTRPTAFTNSYNSIFSHENNATGWTLLIKSSTKLAIYESFGGGVPSTNYDGTGSNTLSANTVYLLEMTWDGTTLEGFVNGSSDKTATNARTMAAASPILRVGNSHFSSRNYPGDIAEFLIFSAPLGSTAQASVRNYLNAKWAVY